MSRTPGQKVPKHERYGRIWRMWWHFEYGLMHVYGPGDLDEARDPRAAMRRERDQRKSAHEARQAVKAAEKAAGKAQG